ITIGLAAVFSAAAVFGYSTMPETADLISKTAGGIGTGIVTAASAGLAGVVSAYGSPLALMAMDVNEKRQDTIFSICLYTSIAAGTLFGAHVASHYFGDWAAKNHAAQSVPNAAENANINRAVSTFRMG
ncbi:MAG TPA: hypothetical protein VIF12_07695, partial [Micavibrio sp.]